VATGLNNLGIAHSMRGDYGKAAAFFRKGLAEYEELGDKTGIANGLNNIGIVHRLQDDAPMALEFHTRALAVKESLGDKASLAGSLNNLGLTYADLGDQRKALEHYGRALRLAEEIGSAHERANVLTNMAAALDLLGEHDEAVATYDRALRAREELGDRWGAARVMSGIAWLHLRRRDHARAVEYAERAAGVAREAGLRTTLAEALTTLGSARLALEQAGAAREAWEEAIAATEDWRTRLAGGEAQQQRAFEGRTSPYYGMVGLHAAVGRAAESLLYAERAKARVLLDVLRSGRVNVTKDMSDRERAEEQRITLALGSLNAALARESRRPSPDASRMAALKSDLEKARLEHQALQAGVYARLPRLRAERGEAPAFRIEEAGPLLPDTRTALVEYAVAEDASYLFTVTRSTGGDVEARVHRLPVERRALEALVTDLRGRMASRDLAVQDRGRKAFDLLLGPAWAELSGREHLVIVPDGALWEVPFQALVTPHGRFLIEDAAVSYAPSLAFLREVSARRRPSPDAIGAFLGVGNPALGKSPPEGARPGRRDAGFGPLPEAEREVKALAELYGPSASRLRIGSEAREESVKADAGGFRVLHFATHGVVNDASPMYSYLLLAQEGPRAEDGLLEAWELMRLDLAAELVVLSACETGRGRVGRGEGMVGLSWALFVAGSPTVVVSQWKVDSASTAKLMIAFHESLRSGRPGATKASALRSAARRLLRARETRHPFFWAAFGVVGDAS
jgi:CHAT domain-containing protein